LIFFGLDGLQTDGTGILKSLIIIVLGPIYAFMSSNVFYKVQGVCL
jgi:hypothetical protein